MSMQTPTLVEQFIDKTLPKSEWTHEAHLRTGLWHVLNYGVNEALSLLRIRIRAYNEAVGGVNTDSSGYHETITKFYVMAIARFLAAADQRQPLDGLTDQLISQFGRRDLPLLCYSREVLFSTQARLHWVEPDICSIDDLLNKLL